MNRIPALIVDDENKSRNILANVLQKYFNHIEVVAECASGNEAYMKALELSPELVFLDIEMPFGNGFDFLAKFNPPPFDIIFLTAHHQYTMQAIKASALDYLLKPLNIVELRTAIEKVVARAQGKHTSRQYEVLLQNFNSAKGRFHNIAIPTHYGLDFIETVEIILLEAEGNYTHLHLTGGRKLLSTRLLKEYEGILPEPGFFRAHHSHIINASHIKKYYKGDGGYVVMSNGITVTISKRRKKDFLELFGEW